MLEYNILIDELPKFVTISNKEFEINSSFRTGILFEQLMLDKDISDNEKVEISLKLYFENDTNLGKEIEDINEAVEKILWFYQCAKDDDSYCTRKKTSRSGINKIYDYDVDQDYIYSAFLQQYNIDLQDIKYMHWWKFRALFKSLNNSSKFTKILEYRSIDLSKIKDKDQKEFYKEMQDLYKIPSKIDKEEKAKIEAINNALRNGLDITDLLKKYK